MLYILIWFIILGLSVYLFKYASGTLSILKPNLISIIFYYSLLVTSFIGALLIVLNIDNFYMTNKLVHQEYRVIGFYMICFVMVMLPLTMALVSKLVGFNAKKEFNEYFAKPVEQVGPWKNEFFWMFAALSGISLLAIVYTILKTPQLPVFELLKGNSNVGELRIAASRHFAGNVYIRNIFGITLTPLLALISYIFAVTTKERKWILLFLLLFPAAVFINVYDLAKTPIFFFILMFIIVSIMVGKTRLTVRKVITIGIIGFSSLILIYVFVGDVRNISSYLAFNKGPIGRLILSQVAPVFLHLDVFGDTIPYLQGRSLPSILTGLFDHESVRSARLVMAKIFPERIESGTGGVLNTLFVAEAYANFGYLGVVLGTIYVGFLVQLIYIIFTRLPKNPVFLCLFVYFSVNIPRTIVGGFTDFLFNTIWIFIVVLFSGLLLYLRVKNDLFSYLKRKWAKQAG